MYHNDDLDELGEFFSNFRDKEFIADQHFTYLPTIHGYKLILNTASLS